MQECRIAAYDLACRRGERVLFAGLGLRLGPGEALHIAGPNGTGKSSLLRIVAGLLRPFAGHFEVRGRIGLLDERPALDTDLPLGEALRFWQRIDGPVDNEAARLGLADLLDVPVRYLSTGQRRRAGLARLIGQDADVWLLDEPLNGLDTDAARLAETLVSEHCHAGGICIIASHQPLELSGMRRIELERFAP